MNHRNFLFACVLAVLTITSRAADFAIDPVHSSLTFKVKHLGVSNVTGHFDKFAGTVSFDPKDLKTLKANATIETASVNTGNEKRDNHLRSADFFDTAKFAQLTFASKTITEVKDGMFKLTGDLTIHGVTKTVTLDGELGGVANSPFGDVRAGFSASTVINRADFGITGGGAGAMVGKEIKITLEIEAAAKK